MTAITRCEQCNEWTQGYHLCLDDTTPLNLTQPIYTPPAAVKPARNGNQGTRGTKDHEREAEIVRLYTDGATAADLAPQYGVTPSRIRQIVRRNGVSRREGVQKVVRSPDVIAEMIELYAQDWSLAAIAKHIHINQGTVPKILRAHGVTIRPARNVKRVAS